MVVDIAALAIPVSGILLSHLVVFLLCSCADLRSRGLSTCYVIVPSSSGPEGGVILPSRYGKEERKERGKGGMGFLTYSQDLAAFRSENVKLGIS